MAGKIRELGVTERAARKVATGLGHRMGSPRQSLVSSDGPKLKSTSTCARCGKEFTCRTDPEDGVKVAGPAHVVPCGHSEEG